MRPTGRVFVLLAAAAAYVLLVQPLAWAASPGSLDSTFSTDGIQTVDVGGSSLAGTEVRVVSGGKVLIAGSIDNDLLLVRLTSSGDPDPGFGGGDGIVSMNLLGSESNYGDVVVVGGGKIVAAVPTAPPSGHVRLGVARFTSAGLPDASFGGGDGKIAIDFGKEFDPYAMAALPNGKLLVSGEFYKTGNDSQFLVARLNPNGSLDHTFGGGDGFVTTQFGAFNDGAWRMAVDSDGRIVVDGWVGEADGVYDTGVARYLSNGAPDHSFSGDGKTTVRLLQGSDDYAYGLALSGSKIIAGIHLENGSTNQIGLERFLSNGALDPSFGGGDGEVLTPTASPGMDLRDIAVDGNGRIVALAGTGLPAQLQLFRYLPSGNLDHGFGTAGASTASSLPSGVSVESMTIGPAGNIVGVGTSEGDVVAARWVG